MPEMLIDQVAIDALFGGLDDETAEILLVAGEDDIIVWCDNLLAAWERGDAEAISRARHSLKGLCGNFGATALLTLCEEDLARHEAADRLRACRSATLAAMREAVVNRA